MSYKEKIKNINRVCVDDEDKFNFFLKELKNSDYVAIDTETSSLNTFNLKMAGSSYYMGGKNAYYIPTGHKKGKQLQQDFVVEKLKEVLKNKKLIFHNFIYDGLVLKKQGLNLIWHNYFDTMVAAHLIDQRQSKGLKKLSVKYLKYKMLTFDQIAEIYDYDSTKVPINKIIDYACDDAIVTYFLFEIFQQKIKDYRMQTLFYKGEMPWLKCLIHSKEVGVNFDTKLLNSYIPLINKEIKETEEKIYSYNKTSQQTLFGGCVQKFDVTSNKQLATFLFRTLRLPVISRNEKTNAASTGVQVLKELENKHPVIKHILKHRKLSKLKSTYIESLIKKVDTDGRLRTDFINHGTHSGRLASKHPNCQQLPNIEKLQGWEKEMALKYNIRKCFIASPGYKMFAIDYSQQELRVAAYMGNDKVMKEVYNDNRDVHLTTANGCLGLGLTNEQRKNGTKEHKIAKEKYYSKRDIGKTLNFSILYGAGAWNVSKRLNISEEKAQKIIDGFQNTYKGIHKYQEKVRNDAINKGYCTTYFGRRRYFNTPKNKKETAAIRREAGNHVIQSFGADVLRFVCGKIYKKFHKTDLNILMYVHDEIVFECKEENIDKYIPEIKNIMENTIKTNPPLLVEEGVGENYYEAK